MIRHDKERHALHAINAVFVQARTMAYQKADHKDLAYVLDIAEYLPMLMLEDRDRTEQFREALEGLATKFAPFNLALERFDAQ
jgi:hypothetical protein